MSLEILGAVSALSSLATLLISRMWKTAAEKRQDMRLHAEKAAKVFNIEARAKLKVLEKESEEAKRQYEETIKNGLVQKEPPATEAESGPGGAPTIKD